MSDVTPVIALLPTLMTLMTLMTLKHVRIRPQEFALYQLCNYEDTRKIEAQS